MTKQDLIECAEELENMADMLHPCDANLPRHAELIFKANQLRDMADKLNNKERANENN